MKCPICKSEVKSLPLKEWMYAKYVVTRYECENCYNKFNVYTENNEIKFTVPKPERAMEVL